LKNEITKRNVTALETRPENFKPFAPADYAMKLWAPSMASTLVIVSASVPMLLVPQIFFYALFFGGPSLILIYLRDLLRSALNRFIFIVMVAYVIGLFYANYKTYASLSHAYAMN